MTITERDGVWIVRLELGRDAQGKRLQEYKRFGTRAEAKKHEALILARQSAGQSGTFSTQTYEDYISIRYFPSLRTRGLRTTTLAGYERSFRLHIIPAIGHVRLRDITTLMLDQFYSDLLGKSSLGLGREHQTLSPHTVAHIHTLISMSLVAAAKWDLIPRNFAATASPPRKQSWHKEVQSWNEAEAAAFLPWLAQDGHRLRALWHLLLTTGVRRGEALALCWSDVDWDNETLTVRRSLTEVRGQGLVFSATKTVKGLRTLAVGSDLLDELRRHQRRQKMERWAAADGWVDEDLIFTRQDGRPLIPTRVSNQFVDLLARAMREGVPVRRITMHGLRHTFVTLQVRGGVHSRIISERAGHHSSAYTVDVYGHVDVQAQERAAHLLQDLLRGVPLRRAQGVADRDDGPALDDVSER